MGFISPAGIPQIYLEAGFLVYAYSARCLYRLFLLFVQIRQAFLVEVLMSCVKRIGCCWKLLAIILVKDV